MRVSARFDPEAARVSGSPESRYKVRAGKWYTPPAETPLYSAVPRATRQYWALLTKAEQALLRLICDERWAKQNPDKSWDARPLGMSALAIELEVDRSSVVRGYRALVAKHCIRQQFEYYRGSRKLRGKRVYVYAFGDALARRKSDPNIALTNDQRVVFRGRGRRPMSPTEAAAWRVQLDRVPEFQEREEDAPDFGDIEPETIAAQVETAAPATAPVIAMPAAPAAALSAADPILEALADVVTTGAAGPADAAECYRSVNDATIPRETVAGWIREMGAGRRKINPHQLLSVGYFFRPRRDGTNPLQAYVTRHHQDAYRAAQESARVERFERDRRINSLADLIRQHDAATDPIERDQLAEFFSDAAPDELAAARDALGAARSRTG